MELAVFLGKQPVSPQVLGSQAGEEVTSCFLFVPQIST